MLESYKQAREKFMSLKKGTRPEVVAELEEVRYLVVKASIIC